MNHDEFEGSIRRFLFHSTGFAFFTTTEELFNGADSYHELIINARTTSPVVCKTFKSVFSAVEEKCSFEFSGPTLLELNALFKRAQKSIRTAIEKGAVSPGNTQHTHKFKRRLKEILCSSLSSQEVQIYDSVPPVVILTHYCPVDEDDDLDGTVFGLGYYEDFWGSQFCLKAVMDVAAKHDHPALSRSAAAEE